MWSPHQLYVCSLGPSAVGPVRGEKLIIEAVAWRRAEVFGENRICDGWRWWQVWVDSGLEGTDGLLLKDVAGEEKEGCKCKD